VVTIVAVFAEQCTAFKVNVLAVEFNRCTCGRPKRMHAAACFPRHPSLKYREQPQGDDGGAGYDGGGGGDGGSGGALLGDDAARLSRGQGALRDHRLGHSATKGFASGGHYGGSSSGGSSSGRSGGSGGCGGGNGSGGSGGSLTPAAPLQPPPPLLPSPQTPSQPPSEESQSEPQGSTAEAKEEYRIDPADGFAYRWADFDKRYSSVADDADGATEHGGAAAWDAAAESAMFC
jgi:hypothetical protein